MQGRVFIIGLGLIGGSIALSIKKAHSKATVIGFDIQMEQVKLAKMLGVIDEIADSLEEGANGADLIIICAPVKETERIIEDLAGLALGENVIITDAGSTKEEIVKKADVLRQRGITFIGGHPMAGSHKSGVTAAKAFLFENAFYLLTPHAEEKEENISKLRCWLKGTNAKFLILAPAEHDYLTGIVSHFPHIIAASLVHHTEKIEDASMLIPRLAAGGFRDITRIASSSPEMWKDILQHNRPVLLQLLDRWQEEMEAVKSMIKTNNGEEIFNYFQKAKKYRDELPANTKGAIPAFYDLFVDVPDYPGVISEITAYLAKERISITNIRIIETREEIYGVLVISFQTEEDRLRAQECIRHYTQYETSI
jgi:prephenate dehydrogenase